MGPGRRRASRRAAGRGASAPRRGRSPRACDDGGAARLADGRRGGDRPARTRPPGRLRVRRRAGAAHRRDHRVGPLNSPGDRTITGLLERISSGWLPRTGVVFTGRPVPRAALRPHPHASRTGPRGLVGAPACARRDPRQREHARLPPRRRRLRVDAPRRARGGRLRRAEGRRRPRVRARRRDLGPDARGRQLDRRRARDRRAVRERADLPGARAGRALAAEDPRDGDRGALVSLFGPLGISASGMTAERLRMQTIAENLANANTTRAADGQPYQRKSVVLQEANGRSFGEVLGGVTAVAITEDQSPGHKVHDPSHPDADKDGYVTMPNVDSVTEMVDLITSQRGYEANVQAMQTTKQMFSRTLDILR